MSRDQDLTAADRVPYRLLEEVHDISVPGGDNLTGAGRQAGALRGLLPLYAGRVKCIYIDPPYNTGSAFEHYHDSLEHAKLLANDGAEASSAARVLEQGRLDLGQH